MLLHRKLLSFCLGLIGVWIFHAPSLYAQATPEELYDRMKAVTVRFWTEVEDTDEGEVVTQQGGTALLLSKNYVVTNAHVAFDRDYLIRTASDPWQQRRLAAANLKFTYVISIAPGREIFADVVWRSPKDVAILKLQQPIPVEVLPFVPTSWVRPNIPIRAMGYPNAADRDQGGEDYYVPSITPGIISKIVSKDEFGRKLYQNSAAINPGNSGGPLFTECGEIMGLNVEKSLTTVRNAKGEEERLPNAEGIAWTLPFEEWSDGLDKLQIPYTFASAPCRVVAGSGSGGLMGGGGNPWEQRLYIAGLLLAILLGGTALVLALTRRGRIFMREAVTRSRELVSRRLTTRGATNLMPGPHKAVLACVGGYFEGVEVELNEQPMGIGRDGRMCQLVYPQDKTEISRRHCLITYDDKDQSFWVEDCWSKNGTYALQSGRIPSGEHVILKTGERFYAGDSSNMFELRLEALTTDAST